MHSHTRLDRTDEDQTRDELGSARARKRQGEGAKEEPRVGRPSGCTPEAVGLLRGVIRELGLSDSAAARRLGIGVSTVARWKRENPEVRSLLQQAREECRAVQLQNIMHAAAAEHGRGWRAAAWLLERLFPEDYSPHAGAREGHRSVAEARERREEEAAEAEARIQRARAAALRQERGSGAQDLQPVGGSGLSGGSEMPREQDVAFTQEGDCRNCRNAADEKTPDDRSPPAGAALSGAGTQCLQPVGGSGAFGGAEQLETPLPQKDGSIQESHFRNCRYAGVLEIPSASSSHGRERSPLLAEAPTLPTVGLSQPREGQLRPQGHDQVQLGHERTQPVGGRGSCGVAELPSAEDVAFTQMSDCRNCRNSAEAI